MVLAQQVFALQHPCPGSLRHDLRRQLKLGSGVTVIIVANTTNGMDKLNLSAKKMAGDNGAGSRIRALIDRERDLQLSQLRHEVERMIGEKRHRQYVADAGSASTTCRIEAIEKVIAKIEDVLCKSGRDGKNDASAKEEETEHGSRDAHTAEPRIGRMRAINVGNGSNNTNCAAACVAQASGQQGARAVGGPSVVQMLKDA